LSVITEMIGSVHQAAIPNLLAVSTKRRTRLAVMINNLSMNIYNSVRYNLVLMLIIITHWTHKHRDCSLNMTSYHHLSGIKMRWITWIIWC